MAGQVSETHTFGPNTVNQFSGSVLYYAAIFAPSDPSGALAALPTYSHFNDGSFRRCRRQLGKLLPGFCFPQRPARVPVSGLRRLSP